MAKEIRALDSDFHALADFLKAELAKADAEERAIHLRSHADFLAFVHVALEEAARVLGVSLGYIAGQIAALYEDVSGGFARGWRDGIARGRGVRQ